MAEKLDDMKARLAELNEERARLDAAIEDMIANMAQVPAEQRAGGPWGRDGASTRKYLELTARQAEVETEIVDLGRAIAASNDAPKSSLH
jgi:hypothetical protein